MRPPPNDPRLIQRMQAAHAYAQRTLHTAPALGGQELWGWHGGTLGRPVITPHGRAWLRLHSAPANQIINTYWNGAIDAHNALPASIPRPRPLAWHDWTDHPWAYRAELREHAPPAGSQATPSSLPIPTCQEHGGPQHVARWPILPRSLPAGSHSTKDFSPGQCPTTSAPRDYYARSPE